MKHDYHISIDEASTLLNKEKKFFNEVMKDGTMTVKYFAPKQG
ncbi:hypothetical protein [Ginsengibacter hankyongi]|nr:hypothetical protein [Ginsengibacter hankyongi]